MSLKDYYPVRREQSGSLDAAVIGGSLEGLLCALSLSQLESISVRVYEAGDDIQTRHGKLVLSVNAQNAIYAISPTLYKIISERAERAHPSSSVGFTGNSGTQRISGSGEPLYTPASRGIHTVLEIDGAELCSLCAQALPRGVLELSHKLTELHEDSDGMALSFQGRPLVRAKLVIGSDPSCAVFARALQSSSPWGRGRIAQLCNDVAPPLGSSSALQGLGLPIEGVVELAYSLSEHGLMPAAIRNFIATMSDRTATYDLQQTGVAPDFSQKAFPPVAQPDALKSAASPPMGTSPPISFGVPPGLKMQDLRSLEPPRGLWNHAAAR